MSKAREQGASDGAATATPSPKPPGALTLAADPQAHYRLIAENARDIVVQMDRDARVLYASPSVREMGYTPEEVIGRPGPDFVHPEDLQRLLDNTAHVLRGGAPDALPNRRYRFKRKDGSYRWCEGNPNRLVDESGAVIGHLNILRDVHESVLAAEALAESEALYRLLADNMNDIVVRIDRDERIVYASPSVRKLGYTPEEMIGRRGSDFVHPDEAKELLKHHARFIIPGGADAPRDRRLRLRLKDGSYRWHEGNPIPLVDQSGAILGILDVIRDVHESVLAAEVLAYNEALYRLLADNMNDVVVRLDAGGLISYASPSWRTLGWAPEEVAGRPAADFVHPDDVAKVRECVVSILGGGPGTPDPHYRLRAKDGDYRLYEGRPSPATDEAGRIVGVINVLRDVTAQVAASDALVASEARYRLLAENMSDIVVKLGVDGRIQYVSPSVRAMGYEPEDLIGHDRSEFIHADEVTRLNENMAQVRSGVLDRRRDRSHRIRHKNGGYRWFDGVPSPITDENGVVIAVINVLRDIHEIKAAEEVLAASEARYRLLADNMGDIVACYGRDGVLTFVSGATKETLGYEPAELLGRNITYMIQSDDLAAADALFEQTAQKGPGAAPFRVEYRMTCKDGSTVWLEAHPRAHHGPDGTFVEWQDVIRDITVHKVLEEKLRAARRRADAATKTKAAFLADMSHELRGPLNSIASFARQARVRPAVPVSVRTSLERIEAASIDMIGMVNDILDFSKLEASEVVFRMQPVALSDLIRPVVGLLEPQAHAKNLELLVVDHTPAGLVLSLDQGRVRQVVANLLGNAIKFTHAGRVSLDVQHDPDRRRLSVSVRDTGPGIAPETVRHLFDRFTQGSDEGGARSYGGAGLGLAISKAIVEGLGGEISVDTKLGQGSCFSFWIPAEPTTEALDHEEPAPRLRIVVAHPDGEVSRLVARSLAPLKVEVLSASDGDSAVRLAARGGVDVILSDLELARASEAMLKLARRRGRHARIPVLALSPVTNDALHTKVLDEGFHGLVAMPFSASDLTSAITHAFAFETGVA